MYPVTSGTAPRSRYWSSSYHTFGWSEAWYPGSIAGCYTEKTMWHERHFFSCFIEVVKIPTWSPTSRADSIPIFEDLEIHLPTTTWLITIVKTPIYRCVFMNGELVNQGYSPITTRGVLHHPSPSIQLYANRWGGAKYAQSLLPFWAFLTTTWWLSMLSCPETIVPLHKQLEIGVLTLTGYPP